MTPELLDVQPLILGECPVWWEGYLYRTDIIGKTLHRIDVNTGREEHRQFSVMIGCFAPRAGGGFVAGTEDGFAFLDFDGASLEFISDPESDKPGNRFNDGKCDPAGRFWAGTKSSKPKDAAVYTLEKDGSVAARIEGVSISNGLAWNGGQSRLYYNDTPTHQIAVFDYDSATGNITNRRVLHDFEGENPDGMTIDTEDNLWVCLWGSSKAVCVDTKSGKIIEEINLPVSQPSSLAFGGAELDTLYITSAREGLSSEQLDTEPLAGKVFFVKPGARGRPVDVFGGIARDSSE